MNFSVSPPGLSTSAPLTVINSVQGNENDGSSGNTPSSCRNEKINLRQRQFCSSAGMSQENLRHEIRRVQNNTCISTTEKSNLIQQLMTSTWREAQKQKPKKLNSMICSPFDIGTFAYYHDKEKQILGCEHYQRSACISASCCDTFFPCRFCHDKNCDHKIDRFSINKVRCMNCSHVQGIAQQCEKCNHCFGRYFCKQCKLFDDTPNKHIYHCDDCKLCRIGEGIGIDYFHCHKCNACMSISLKDHKCIEGSLESNCPVCHEYMFTSTSPVMFLGCGHCLHVECYNEYSNCSYTCPICSKSMGDMTEYFERIDASLYGTNMPLEYQHMRNLVFCADCEKRSEVPFHFVYHKCQHCKSYNTRVLKEVTDHSDL